MNTVHKTLIAAGAIVATIALSVAPLLTSSSPAVPAASAASSDYFLKIEGIEGESRAKGHENEIEIQSFSWGIASPRDAASGLPTGKRQHKPFTITKRIDKATPLLFKRAAEGGPIRSVVLSVPNSQGQDYYKVTLEDVLISGFEDAGAGAVSEEVSFNYGKIMVEYRPQNADGSLGAPIKAGYDLKQNKGI